LVKLVNLLFRYTLNNVIFGITLMVLIAAYIAVGSGVPSVREYFEMNELQFFNAWPLKVLMLLLCLNLIVVTTNRIPLTPPRYGVWCIHAGIIILITGTSLYYHLKVEGKTLIPLGHTVNLFYDSGQRALYARVLKGETYGMHPLPSLPRYGSYDDAHDPDRLRRSDLSGINSFIPIGLPSNSSNDLSSWLGLSQPVTLDVVGYYSYADVVEDVTDDPTSTTTGVEVNVDTPRPDGSSRFMLRATDPTASHQFFGPTELEYRQVSPDSLAVIRDSTNRLFELTATLPGESSRTLDAGIGKPAEVGAYTITVDAYDPAFQLFGSEERVQTLTLHIVHKAGGASKEFWRMILMGRALQTDFKMDPATTAPFVKGNRQKTPIDSDLVLGFRVTDAAALLPTANGDKHILLSAGDRTLLDIHTTFSNPADVRDFTSGGEIDLSLDGSPVKAQVRRKDHFKVLTHVEQTPPHKRNKDEDEAGSKQVAVVRVKCGDWSQDVVIPCDLYAAPDPMLLEPMVAWTMGVVQIPGASAPLQLQLGYACLPMPVALKLQNFDMIPYPGGQGATGMFRDFASTLVMTDPLGQSETAKASLNSPIYYNHGSWIFFQAGYDPDGQSSTIGVGNRPGVGIMLMGCIMIVSGFLYAFYIKPIIIRRMKATALAKARSKMHLVASGTGAA
jgi:hypothetical protein